MSRSVTQKDFLKDVRNHQMTIINDDGGVCRYLRFKQPNTSNRYFDITTWNGHLCISGDMGTFVFSRLFDMFEFFRDSKLRVNYGYWGEKLQSVSRFAGYEVFDSHYVLESIKERINYLAEEYIPEYYVHLSLDIKDEYPTIEAITEAFKNDAIEHFENAELCEYRHAGTIDEWESEIFPNLSLHGYEGNDWDYEWLSGKRLSYNYKWCCRAIVWAINQYDRSKSPIVIPSYYQAITHHKDC